MGVPWMPLLGALRIILGSSLKILTNRSSQFVVGSHESYGRNWVMAL